MLKQDEIELLAPARDLECGIAAIDAGADAVYIGAARYGARAKAGNALIDIETLARHAHTYWAWVYVTLNTLLYDDELAQAVRLAHQLHDVGVDALIIQDVGLLECDLPPIPLIASTQMHNHTPERIAFLEQVGFSRVILARELSLAQIRAISQATTIELEAFIHGTLCVSYSGQCYMSYAIGGRSGNRGECAQPCRRLYSLVDREGQTLVSDRYLLSLKDLNLTSHLAELIDAGVCSFKIEGRMKDQAYVTNVVSHYRREIDRILESRGLLKSSSGQSQIDFTPDPVKTFNRGYSTHFLHDRAESPGAIDTPKMIGELVGRVVAVGRRTFTLDTAVPLHPGDGICFFDQNHRLGGTLVNKVRARVVTPNQIVGIKPGTLIYRNHDHAFLKELEKSHVERTVGVRLELGETATGLTLSAANEDGNIATVEMANEKARARKPDLALSNAHEQLRKMGGTAFRFQGLDVQWRNVYFAPFSVLNELRRRVLEELLDVRLQNRPIARQLLVKNDVAYPAQRLSYRGNVLNQQAAAFYRRHGVVEIEPAIESGLDVQGRVVMRTRYCIKHQVGLCPRLDDPPAIQEPLYLVDEDEHHYELRFDCVACEMEVLAFG